MKNKKVTFKHYEQNQGLLFPGYIDEKIPKDHLVRTISTVIDSLNLSQLEDLYQGGGASSYHPRMMLKVLIYAYSQKIYSSRGIAKALRENIFFMWLSGKNTPDFRTINLFRKTRLSGELHRLFTEIVRILLDGGFITMKDLFVDGTKLDADANKYTVVWKKSTVRYKDRLAEQVKELFQYIDQLEEAEEKEYEGYDLPEMGERMTITSEEIQQRIADINKRLESNGHQELEKVKKKLENDMLARMKKYETQLEIMGKRNSYSKTDHDATFMRMKADPMMNGQLKAGYNVQIGTENQYILAYGVYQRPTDTTLLPDVLNTFKQQYGFYPVNVIADAGYGSEENYEYLESAEINGYVKYNTFHREKKKKFKEDPYRVDQLSYSEADDTYTCPAGKILSYVCDKKDVSGNGYESTKRIYECEDCIGCDDRMKCHQSKTNRTIQVNSRLNELKKKARDNLESDTGLSYRGRRCVDVEPVFAQIKHNRGYKRFTKRGLKGASAEWGLLSIAHNLIRMHNEQIVT